MRRQIRLSRNEFITLAWLLFNGGVIEFVGSGVKARSIKKALRSLARKGVIECDDVVVTKVFGNRFDKVWRIEPVNFKVKDFEVVYVDSLDAFIMLKEDDSHKKG